VVLDLARKTPSRFTTNDARDFAPVWSPDGQRIVFASDRDGPSNLYVKNAGGATQEEQLLKNENPKVPSDWHGDYVLYTETSQKTGLDIWAVPVSGDRKPFAVVQTSFAERRGRLSPDGHWIAYESNESGRPEVYVQSFPPPSGNRWIISKDGGQSPRWRRDGKELFFYATGGGIMSVDVKAQRAPNEFEVDDPHLVRNVLAFGAAFDVSSDGQRFLVNGRATQGDSSRSTLTVILNWAAGLSAKN